jgi:DNA mismatch endonuclease (patch repair protein)
MSAVRSKDTKLELAFRRRLFAMGLRFRLHRKGLPGTPDMVFPKYSTAIFIHGCYWHRHGCHLSGLPQTRRAWWRKKLGGNWQRDKNNRYQLMSMGWRVLTIWECSFRKAGLDRERMLDTLALKAREFLWSNKPHLEIPRTRFDQMN